MNLNSTNMNFLLLSVLALSSCKPSIDPTPSEVTVKKSDLILAYESMPDGLNYSLAGDTTRPNTLTPLHPLVTQNLDVSALKSPDGSLKYVAIGASLTAGVRDGGWFNEGMNTSYPNLIARQMGITNFQQPLFEDKEFNGYGLKLPTTNTETPVPRYKAVSNNLAFKPQGTEMVLTPYSGNQLNNLAVPNLLYGGDLDLMEKNTFDNKYYKWYLNRIVTNERKNIRDKAIQQNPNFYSVEIIHQDILNTALTGGLQHSSINAYGYPVTFEGSSFFGVGGAEWTIKSLKDKGINYGIILNIPNILNIPYFKNGFHFSRIKAIFDNFGLKNIDYGYDMEETLLYLPTVSADSLFKYQNNKSNFLNYYLKRFKPIVISKEKQNEIVESINFYNKKHFFYISNNYKIPIVDIATLYQQINDGTLIVEGKKVTDKEFFSSDGIYPTAFGQALIANECIKTINSFYKTNIPLIQASYYLNR